MNIGRTEGSQIIQLFASGVRLKGFNLSLKRSDKLELPEEVTRPKHIEVLETLSIFGIRADYMEQFRDFLQEEGLRTDADRREFLLPLIKNLGTQKLKTIKLKNIIDGVSTEVGDPFRTLGPIPTLAEPDPLGDSGWLVRNQIVLNWYPKIQSMRSDGVIGGNLEISRNETHLNNGHIAFLNLDRLYFELQRFKAERGWHNLNIPQESVARLLADQSWYRLLIPAQELLFDSFEKVRLWEEIALALLKKYTERYYTFRKRQWEMPHLEYQQLTADDPNFAGFRDEPGDGYYRILIETSKDEIVAKLEELKNLIQKGELKTWEFHNIKAISFNRHLYQPLLFADKSVVEIRPVPLNKGEWQFVEDLRAFHESHSGFFANRELYLLRNRSKGRGVGFFEAGNFHPDFILWLLVGAQQHVIFVDPKGILNLDQRNEKIEFYADIKTIERRLADPDVRLDSFIISVTPSHKLKARWRMDKAAMTARHVLFQEEDKTTYVKAMFEAVVREGQ